MTIVILRLIRAFLWFSTTRLFCTFVIAVFVIAFVVTITITVAISILVAIATAIFVVITTIVFTWPIVGIT
ncbi:hypothetical protein [Psychrosphaera algicola]|uniref:hypothetical protein n=1 Tax=Psychrosphaera algicola TaxID=3023714 RepID=UPI00351CF01E